MEDASAAALREDPSRDRDLADIVTVQGVRCFKEVQCIGGTGAFQRHNFDGSWRVGEDLTFELPRYQHVTPGGQVVYLFHVKSAYGGVPRWVIGPVPGNENGWAFVDTDATRPENITERRMVWMETKWEESKRLYFRGKEDNDDNEVDDDDEVPQDLRPNQKGVP